MNKICNAYINIIHIYVYVRVYLSLNSHLYIYIPNQFPTFPPLSSSLLHIFPNIFISSQPHSCYFPFLPSILLYPFLPISSPFPSTLSLPVFFAKWIATESFRPAGGTWPKLPSFQQNQFNKGIIRQFAAPFVTPPLAVWLYIHLFSCP